MLQEIRKLVAMQPHFGDGTSLYGFDRPYLIEKLREVFNVATGARNVRTADFLLGRLGMAFPVFSWSAFLKV